MNGRVLVTGCSGTFGKAFIRRCLNDGAERVVGISRNEWQQALMEDEFKDHPALRLFIGDVRDYNRLRQAMHGVDVVVAAAALKRIGTAAYNPQEATRTNVHGIENTIRAAVAEKVSRVIVVSSDKAVAPTTFYGQTKAMAETTAIQSNVWSHPQGCRVSCVRYGNVLGSRGSVIQHWQRQVKRGEALHITDARMSRFVMTIEQAVDLVEWTAGHMLGGEIVVPELPSVTITELAEAIAPGHPTVEVGVRDGSEKLAESLLCDDEPKRTVRVETPDLAYFVVTPQWNEWSTDVWPGARLPAATIYRSDLNERWLTADQIRSMLAATEAVA
jgi:UDP-N-acetylglucosamine 4,6-dehydratase